MHVVCKGVICDEVKRNKWFTLGRTRRDLIVCLYERNVAFSRMPKYTYNIYVYVCLISNRETRQRRDDGECFGNVCALYVIVSGTDIIISKMNA